MDETARVVEDTLTDGSTVHNVVIRTDDGTFGLFAVDQANAEKIAALINDMTVGAYRVD